MLEANDMLVPPPAIAALVDRIISELPEPRADAPAPHLVDAKRVRADSIASLKAFIERSQEDNKLREELRVKLKTCAPPIFLSKLTRRHMANQSQLWSFGSPCAVADTPLKTARSRQASRF